MELQEQVTQLQEQLQEKEKEVEKYKTILKSGNAEDIQELMEKVTIHLVFLCLIVSNLCFLANEIQSEQLERDSSK